MPIHSRFQGIANQIQARIEAGEWEPGAHLPRLNDLAAEYGANRDTIARAITLLEASGHLWAVQGRGTVVRWGTIRPRRPRGNLVKRNLHLTGYSFPSASAGEEWANHGQPDNSPTPLTDERIAGFLKVRPGTVVPRRFRITGPIGEPPFQINTSWIRPELADIVNPVDKMPRAGEWLVRIEEAGHWPIDWREIHRPRMPTSQEAAWLEIPVTMPVLEIVRIGESGGDQLPVEVTEYVLAGDRVEQHIKLERDESASRPRQIEETS